MKEKYNSENKLKKITEFRKNQIILCKKCDTQFNVKVTDNNYELGIHKKFCTLSCSNSFNKMGDKNPMFNKSSWSKGKTKETDARIKSSAEKNSGDKHYNFGKNLTEEHKNKIKKSLDNDLMRNKLKKPIKQKYQEKYGELWEIHYNVFLEKMKKVNTLEWFINNFGEQEGLNYYKKRSDNLKKNSHIVTHPENFKNKAFSKISQELFWVLYSEIKKTYKKIYFAELNNEHSCSTGSYCFDFVVIDNKKIIEFNGDKFHPRENLNSAELEIWSTPHGIPGIIISNRDKIKKEKSHNNGFEILYIWESEYKLSKENEIKKCLNFLKK